MSAETVATGLWRKALEDVSAIRLLGSSYANITASRAYYAVFHAVSAHFALQGREFARHEAVQAAVHRDLVKPGVWPVLWGRWYDGLLGLRRVGDYGAEERVLPGTAEEAIARSETLVEAIRALHPDVFPRATSTVDEEETP
jgi:uncharacterized protein (UPF0332 family)